MHFVLFCGYDDNYVIVLIYVEFFDLIFLFTLFDYLIFCMFDKFVYLFVTCYVTFRILYHNDCFVVSFDQFWYVCVQAYWLVVYYRDTVYAFHSN